MASKISAIEKEFVINQAISEHIEVRIHASRTHASFIITKHDKDFIYLNSSTDLGKGFASWDKISGYINYRGQTLSFKTKIRKVEPKAITIANPECFYKNLARKFVRIASPHGIQVAFSLQDEEFSLDYPVCEEYSPVDQIENTSNFDISSMPHLIESFKANAKVHATAGKIVMFKQKKPETLEEMLVSKFGKILYIPSTTSGLPVKDPYPDGRLITKKMEEDFEGPDYFIKGSSMDRLLLSKIDAQIHSEIFCPILYCQYVAGYVYLVNSNDKRISFHLETVDMAYDFSRILAYYLKTHDYFAHAETKNKPLAYAGEIIDISASGLLLGLPQKEFNVLLKQNTLVSLKLTFGDRIVDIKARVMRRYEENNMIFYGLVFQGLLKTDEDALYSFIYHREKQADSKEESEVSFVL